MMRINKTTQNAIRILIHCARAEDRLLKVAEIAQALDITQQNSFKIVHLLAKAGFLKAMRGRYGGVRLARAAAEIRVGDVVQAIEGLSSEDSVTRDGSQAAAAGAGKPMTALFDTALHAFVAVLNQMTLADMATELPARKTAMLEVPRARRTKAPAKPQSPPDRPGRPGARPGGRQGRAG